MLGDFRTEDERADAPRSHRRKDSGKSLIAMTLVVALFGVIGVGGWWAYNNFVKDYFVAEDFSGEGNGTEVAVTVEEGWTVSDIAGQLEEQGVVGSAKAFLNASEDDGNSGTEIQPGTYTMQGEMSAASALAFLLDEANRMTNAVTIPEGFRIFEVFTRLSEHTGVPVEDFEAIAGTRSRSASTRSGSRASATARRSPSRASCSRPRTSSTRPGPPRRCSRR